MKQYFSRPTCIEGSQQATKSLDLNGPGLPLTMTLLSEEERKQAEQQVREIVQNQEKEVEA